MSAFALLRTMGFVPDVAIVLDPCLGEISSKGEDIARRPYVIGGVHCIPTSRPAPNGQTICKCSFFYLVD